MFNKKDEVQYNKINTLVDKDCEIEGIIHSKGTVRIDGTFKGELVIEGNLYIGETGNIIGNVQVGNVLVSGQIKGNVNATEQLRIASTGCVYGDVNVNTFILDENAIFEGYCKMKREKGNLSLSPVLS